MSPITGVIGTPDSQLWKMIEKRLGKTPAEPEFEPPVSSSPASGASPAVSSGDSPGSPETPSARKS